MDETTQLIENLESFLKAKGLALQHEQSHGVNWLRQYGDDKLKVRAVLDRRVWFVEVADAMHILTHDFRGRPHPHLDWYYMALICEYFCDPRKRVMSLAEQIEALILPWPEIVAAFAPGMKDQTHEGLVVLRRNKA